MIHTCCPKFSFGRLRLNYELKGSASATVKWILVPGLNFFFKQEWQSKTKETVKISQSLLKLLK